MMNKNYNQVAIAKVIKHTFTIKIQCQLKQSNIVGLTIYFHYWVILTSTKRTH